MEYSYTNKIKYIEMASQAIQESMAKNVDLNTSISKIAMVKDLNRNEIERVVQSANQMYNEVLMKKAADKHETFDLADTKAIEQKLGKLQDKIEAKVASIPDVFKTSEQIYKINLFEKTASRPERQYTSAQLFKIANDEVELFKKYTDAYIHAIDLKKEDISQRILDTMDKLADYAIAESNDNYIPIEKIASIIDSKLAASMRPEARKRLKDKKDVVYLTSRQVNPSLLEALTTNSKDKMFPFNVINGKNRMMVAIDTINKDVEAMMQLSEGQRKANAAYTDAVSAVRNIKNPNEIFKILDESCPASLNKSLTNELKDPEENILQNYPKSSGFNFIRVMLKSAADDEKKKEQKNSYSSRLRHEVNRLSPKVNKGITNVLSLFTPKKEKSDTTKNIVESAKEGLKQHEKGTDEINSTTRNPF